VPRGFTASCRYWKMEVAQSTIAKYIERPRRPPSQSWKTFLRNHAAGIASIDLLVVRTISFKLLYRLVIRHDGRRRLVTVSVTSNPTAEWIAGQVTAAFPWSEAPQFPIRDRDGAYGRIGASALTAVADRSVFNPAHLALARKRQGITKIALAKF
jgi:hypothetical protein